MKYNIAYKTNTDFGSRFIFLLDENQIEKFSKDFKNGERNFFHGGTTYPLSGTIKILVYDTSTLPTIDLEYIKKFFAAMTAGRTHPSVDFIVSLFSDFGVDVTSKFITDSWGKGKEEQQVASVSRAQLVSQSRIEELISIKSNLFDLTKLIQLCKELNSSNQNENWLAVGALVRAILDHIPPIFNCKNFDEVANNYKSVGDAKSFKESMLHIIKIKNIADSFLHSQIRKSEVLPTETQIDCKRDLDKLLGEIVRTLK